MIATTENVTPKRQTYTIAEAATILGLSLSNTYRLARDGRIPSVRIGGRLLVPRAVLRRLLNPDEGDGL